MPRSATWILVRDELIGFARSKVMLVLWIILPCITLTGFLLIHGELVGVQQLTAVGFMSLLESNVAGAAAALLIAVDLVSERHRNVYPLLVIRPVRREMIVVAKFLAVFGCVAVGCIVSLLLGIVVDLARGTPPSAAGLHEVAEALVAMTTVNALATAGGALFGVCFRSILATVLMVLYVGNTATVIPMLPYLFPPLHGKFWLLMVISFALVVLLVWLAGRVFRSVQL